MKKKKTIGNIVFFLCLFISIGVFAYAGWHLAVYVADYGQEAKLEEELKNMRPGVVEGENEASTTLRSSSEEEETHEQGKARYKEQYQALKTVNEDYLAWIEIADTDISYPVVQRDNVFYLTHDFKQEKSSHGSIFLDEACNQDSPVWLLHGHHMKDGSMFGGLKKFEKKDYIETHRTIYLDGEKERSQYKVFAAALIDFTKEDESQIFHYEQLPASQQEWNVYREKLKRHAYWYDEEESEKTEGEAEQIKEKDILILSTCEYHTGVQRLIIVAKKER